MTGKAPRPTPLTDGLVLLDEPREDDAPAVLAAQDEDTRVAFGDHRPDTPQKANRWIAAARRLWAEPEDEFDGRYAVRRVGDLALVGWLQLWRAGEVAYVLAWLDPSARDAKLGTAAVRLACDHAFGALGVGAVRAHITPANARSRSLARSLGFRVHPEEFTSSKDRTGMALVYELPREAWPPSDPSATASEVDEARRALDAHDADPESDHPIYGPPEIVAFARQRRRAELEDALQLARRGSRA